jgi:hypothetical protein
MPAGGTQETMSDPHATDAPGRDASAGGGHHASTDQGDDHGHDHGHADEALGPVDVAAWGAGILGIGIAVVIAAAFALATSGLG